MLHDPGTHRLTQAEVGSRYAAVALRILVDSQDPAEVNRLQDQVTIEAGSAELFASSDYDAASAAERGQCRKTFAPSSRKPSRLAMRDSWNARRVDRRAARDAMKTVAPSWTIVHPIET